MKAEFTGKVIGGKMAWTDPNAVRKFFDTVGDQLLKVTIEAKRAKRSDAQNRYWYGVVIRALSEHTGYNKEEMNDIIESLFLSSTKEVGGRIVTVGGRVKSLDTHQFNELKEQVQQWAAQDLELYIPDPDEDYFTF